MGPAWHELEVVACLSESLGGTQALPIPIPTLRSNATTKQHKTSAELRAASPTPGASRPPVVVVGSICGGRSGIQMKNLARQQERNISFVTLTDHQKGALQVADTDTCGRARGGREGRIRTVARRAPAAGGILE